jgi:cysteinyl-tRNA synthetase
LALFVYNSQTQKKEAFVPIDPGKVRMYVCGPTVYQLLHVGNFRGAIFFDMVRNWLEYRGFEVNYVYNFTDVDDKIIKKAESEGVSAQEISERYIAEFKKDYSALDLKPHSANPKVTDYIPQIIEMIDVLIKRGHAYEVNGDVVYAVRSFPEYGKLSHRNIDELQSGARVEVDEKKRDPLDFALWKAAKPGEPFWESPWGAGRPGWHIECSAMTTALLGEEIDIHGGGVDLIFPHHENEVAQSEGCTGRSFVRYWMHNEMLTFSGQKMSKSLGNILTGRDFLAKYNAEILKYLMLSAHYRSKTDYSEQRLEDTIAGLARVYSALRGANYHLPAAGVNVPVDSEFANHLQLAWDGVEKSLDDDFNTPEVFARIFEVVREWNSSVRPGQKPNPKSQGRAKAFIEWMGKVSQIIGLFRQSPIEYLKSLDIMLMEHKKIDPTEVERVIAMRNQARANRDYAKADELRVVLSEMGIAIQDSPDGTIWEVDK